MVVNRVKGNVYELSRDEIKRMLGIPIIAEIPEDSNIALSLAIKKPLVEYSPNSPAAIEIKKLAAWLSGKKYEPPKSSGSKNLVQRFVNWLKG